MSLGMGEEIDVAAIAPEELARRTAGGGPIDLVDVRTPAEYREVHAAPARLVPLNVLDAEAFAAERARTGDSQTLYVICRTGGRGAEACRRLRAAGCRNVVNVQGGTLAWERAGLPVVRGKATISLERQVRIAAGSMVVAGTVLGAWVHPVFLGLAAIVGAGLVFAGVSDTCGMGMLLARMPWNQVGDKPAAPSCSVEERAVPDGGGPSAGALG